MRHVRNLAVLLLIAFTTSSCAYFLSPEQRGNRGGRLDTPAIVGDILWFIPGIVPGVVALVVDYSSGAIYKNPGWARRPGYGQAENGAPRAAAARVVEKGSRLVVRPPVVKQPTLITVRIVSGGQTLAVVDDVALPGDNQARPISLAVPGTLPSGGGGELQLVVDGKLEGRLPCTFR